jgi:hypothetical protein
MHISVAGMSGIRTITNTHEGGLDSIARLAWDEDIDVPHGSKVTCGVVLIADRDALQEGYRDSKSSASVNDLIGCIDHGGMPDLCCQIGAQQDIAPRRGYAVEMILYSEIEHRPETSIQDPANFPFMTFREDRSHSFGDTTG